MFLNQGPESVHYDTSNMKTRYIQSNRLDDKVDRTFVKPVHIYGLCKPVDTVRMDSVCKRLVLLGAHPTQLHAACMCLSNRDWLLTAATAVWCLILYKCHIKFID